MHQTAPPHSNNGTTPDFFAARLGPDGDSCAACGGALAADQRYCLNCGARRAATRVPFPEPAVLVESGPASAPAPLVRRELPFPVWSGLAGVAAVSLGILAGILIMNQRGPETQAGAALVAATPTPVVAAPTAVPTVVATAEATVAAVTEFTPDWPAGTDGWTVQLQTLPKDGTTPQAIADAKAALTAQGAADVGALDSDEYASLDPSQYVLYSTVSTSKADAQGILDGIKANFPDAKVVEVSAAAAEPEATPEKETKEPEPAFESPEEAQKNMREAPDQVESEGTPPPADNEKPGGDSEATEF
ncbi:hypothetical protein OJ997_31020 [Solirubrobacter phytolaccae]|uniref:Uncharacterized protein n=1 Tax=Solirubrobacter phytolaccae TaxID=1404360 RepID=A0A9X3SED8_9ACTN|nr:hypothetical protein [Solirubrobacter phytolaccae]MDA0184775.1 hypothetical protein [Solirubrobacter phytolaccae]